MPSALSKLPSTKHKHHKWRHNYATLPEDEEVTLPEDDDVTLPDEELVDVTLPDEVEVEE